MESKDASTNTAVVPLFYNYQPNDVYPMHFWLKQKKGLENIIRFYDIEGMSLVIESRELESDALSTRTFIFSYEDYVMRVAKFHRIYPQMDDINQLIVRIDLLQVSFQSLLSDLHLKAMDLAEEYKHTHFRITSTVLRNPVGSRLGRLAVRGACDNMRYSGECDFDGYRIQSTYFDEYPKILEPHCNILIIGPNGTQVDRKGLTAINWKDFETATKEVCTLVFGKPLSLSTFYGLAAQELNAQKAEDIAYLVCSMFSMSQRQVKAEISARMSANRLPTKELPGGLVKFQ